MKIETKKGIKACGKRGYERGGRVVMIESKENMCIFAGIGRLGSQKICADYVLNIRSAVVVLIVY